MSASITPLLKCVCGNVGTRRVIGYEEQNLAPSSIIACETCFNKTRERLAHVRPVFDLMIERGISRGVANRTMSFMLEQAEPRQ